MKAMLRNLISVVIFLTGQPAFGAYAGSGFFITTDGYFVTNFHVVAKGNVFGIRTINDKRYSARLIRGDQANDLAILKVDVDEGEFTPLPIDDSLNVKRGTKVVTIGFPHLDLQGIEPKVTEGIVNSLTGMKDDPRYFQISLQVGSGNSGGPLINMSGNVVGVVSAKLSADAVYAKTGDVIQNVNYAVKSNYLRELVNSIPDLQEKLSPVSDEIFKNTEGVATKVEGAVGMVINFGINESQLQAGKAFRDCTGCPEMVPIPPSGKIKRAFAIGKYEVTQNQWQAIMGNNPSYLKSCGDNCPVEQVSWNDAQEFAKKLSAKTGKQYRLPTADEWEYACHAGDQQAYCGSDDAYSVAWYLNNSNGSVHPVGRKKPNFFGLYDMSGNLWEWVQDCFNDNCTKRTKRGGSWLDIQQHVRAVGRDGCDPSKSYSFTGFRLARMLP